MQVKINREIRDYQENLFFGLSFRQCLFSALAILVAVGLYFGLRSFFALETISWICILGAIPFAALGFIRYHGMPVEKFILVWIRSEFLIPKILTFHAKNFYFELLQPLARHKKGKGKKSR